MVVVVVVVVFRGRTTARLITAFFSRRKPGVGCRLQVAGVVLVR